MICCSLLADGFGVGVILTTFRKGGRMIPDFVLMFRVCVVRYNENHELFPDLFPF
jgi:hypothetical protein